MQRPHVRSFIRSFARSLSRSPARSRSCELILYKTFRARVNPSQITQCDTHRRPIRQIMRPNGLMVIRALRRPLSSCLSILCLLSRRTPARFVLIVVSALPADTYESLIKREDTPHALSPVSVARETEIKREEERKCERKRG